MTTSPLSRVADSQLEREHHCEDTLVQNTTIVLTYNTSLCPNGYAGACSLVALLTEEQHKALLLHRKSHMSNEKIIPSWVPDTGDYK